MAAIVISPVILLISLSMDTRTQAPKSALSFVVDSLCVVTDPKGSLERFYAELSELEAGRDTVINIVHLGDSHIQAGYLSGRTMRLLQSQFGNAGRGWISPLKIGRTNEPDDYFLRTLVKEWTVGRCVQLRPQCDTGIGGIGIRTQSPFVNFDIIMTPNNGAGYSTRHIVAYRGMKSMPLLPAAMLSDSSTVTGEIYKDLRMATDTIRLPRPTDSLQLQTTRRKIGTDSLLPASMFDNLYYGFNLSNGQPGILYHSIGINGAKYADYSSDIYIRRLATLKPSLLIVSLGTNESFARNFSVEEFSGQVETFLALVRKHLPQAAVLIVTPPECFKRTTVNKKRVYVRNDNIQKVAQALTDIAGKRGLACWDFFRTTGGKDSSSEWFKGKWMSRDRIHFSKEAYYEQGALLYRAIINGRTNDNANDE
jgi:lysophospholipase L1-like esterase